ncbi:MAG: glucose-6-phosphate isomerase [Actinobacteria bacterium]|nr:glucose-6-phosphate isomerase [Actinomycetota bacterium]
MQSTPGFKCSEWTHLTSLAQQRKSQHIRELFDADSDRVAGLTFQAGPLTLDFSRQRVDSQVIESLLNLARQVGVEAARDAMFAGEHINNTEDRAVLHTALRLPKSAELVVDGQDVVADVHNVLESMAVLANQVRSGEWVGATGLPIRNVVNIGIGGSDLGPVMAYEALRNYSSRNLHFYFVSNVDGTDVSEVLKQVNPLETLFIVASKTFSTIETMMNAATAREALLACVPEDATDAVSKHFVAVSTHRQRVIDFGIDPNNMFGFWDWVGGRYSMDSSIGLSTMLAIGPEGFEKLLAGFNAMDEHFKTAAPENNVPILMALIGLWNRSFLGIETVAVLPYDQYLKRFPAYLQQLIMESNGKSVTSDGEAVPTQTSAVYWGEPGTNGQHSFYQMLHQGTSIVACDVLVPAKSHNPAGEHHDVLVSNALAQVTVLAFGRTKEQVQQAGTVENLVTHKVMPGNRPTTLITLDEIDPFALGSLIALYEHMVFVQGIVWGINSFDQWGVELGKEMATTISPYLTNSEDLSKFDAATQFAINWYRANRRS